MFFFSFILFNTGYIDVLTSKFTGTFNRFNSFFNLNDFAQLSILIKYYFALWLIVGCDFILQQIINKNV